ncbi:YdeI/OmpD-associated family protein [Daejeonella sp.]|uniref:YdeI/OmpD-associated family protein n=1 Tax=Daejeonella sp. TaxID=2805397 RepID=UPI002730912D|nr:YdeI/OmpD-associated family protein [Daejeonella sp.]MDP2413757.1 YdeI/OmpD-associated family protein [Daejeonella sp.]
MEQGTIMMSSWEETSKYGLRPVASVAINETWTALRFRPNDQIKNSDVSNSSIRVNELSTYIDVDKRIITLPPELIKKLNPQAADFFKSLSYTNKKEYVTWILTAKQEKPELSGSLKALKN